MKKISDLRVVLEFQTEAKVEQPDYTYEHVWTTVHTDRGELKTVSGQMMNRGESPEPSGSHQVTIRHRDDIDLFRGMRIRAEGINFTIHKVIIDLRGKHKYYVMSVEQEETHL